MNNRRKLILALAIVFAVNLLLILLFQSADAASYKQGSSGETVKQIQTRLKNWGYYSYAVDGIYGSRTTAAVKKFQKNNGLEEDGIAGPATLSKMGISSSTAWRRASWGPPGAR